MVNHTQIFVFSQSFSSLETVGLLEYPVEFPVVSVWRDCMLIFGGSFEKQPEILIFDLATSQIQSLIPLSDASAVKKATGIVTNDDRFIIFGGVNETGAILDLIQIFNLVTHNFETNRLVARMGMSSVYLPPFTAYLFGGEPLPSNPSRLLIKVNLENFHFSYVSTIDSEIVSHAPLVFDGQRSLISVGGKMENSQPTNQTIQLKLDNCDHRTCLVNSERKKNF